MNSSGTPVLNADISSTKFNWKWRLSDLDSIENNGRTVFSCFACGGGSSMGYKLAGFDVIGNCEIDPDMMEVYLQNNHPHYPFLMDVRDFLKLPDEKIPSELFELDVLDGSPPCSVFSLAGAREEGWNIEKKFREGQAKQRLDDLFFFFIDIAKRFQPKVVIAENVKGILTGKARGWVNRIVKAFDDAGYTVQIFLFNAARMGVPQKRERAFFIAHRKDLELQPIKLEFNEPFIPFKDVRTEKGNPLSENSSYHRLVKYRIGTDRDLSDINRRVTGKMSGFTAALNHDEEPSNTITAGGDIFRYYDGLLLTDQDIINCQTFPQDYDFRDQKVKYVCGMSVPPVMMAKIAEQVYKQWLR